MRSSALDMARAPSGPILLSAKQSASANTHNYTPGYHCSDFHCGQGRLTLHIQVGERGVAFQRTRYGTCTLRPKSIACKAKDVSEHAQLHAAYPSSDIQCSESRLTVDSEAGERGVAFQRTRYGTCTLQPKIILCKTKRVSKKRSIIRPDIIAATFIAARVDSRCISR